MGKRIVIHRDRTFEFNDEKWLILGGGPGTPNEAFGYELWNEEKGQAIDGFFTYEDIRRYLAEAVEAGWETLADDETAY